MAVSFNTIPNNVRLPLAYVEFDNSLAVSGTPSKDNKMLLLGLKLASGESPALEPIRITRAAQAEVAFGRGSMLSEMVKAYIKADSNADLYAMAIDDVSAPVFAKGEITVLGECSNAGQIALMIAGIKLDITCYIGDSAITIATAIADAINENQDLPVVASNIIINGETENDDEIEDGEDTESDDSNDDLENENDEIIDEEVEDITETRSARTSQRNLRNLAGVTVELKAKWGGLTGNDIDIRINYYDGEQLPQGVGVEIEQMAGGVGNPDLADVITNLGDDVWWSDIVNPFTDTQNLDLLADELVDRWGGIRQIDGTCWMAYRGTHAQSSTFALKRNDYLFTCMPTNIAPQPPYIWASVNAAVCTKALGIDPARPVQTLELTGIKPPALSDRWAFNERNLHLFDGLCATNVNASGNVQLDRVITMYRVNKYNIKDTSYLDIETIKTLSYIRYAIRQRITSRFPRHKLANDGTRFGAGQAIVTPSIIKTELLSLFTELENQGLVEDFDNYRDSLIVERNANDPNRIDVLSNDDLVNQFRVYAHCIQFLL